MKIKTLKITAFIFAFVMMFGLFAAMPSVNIAVSAETWGDFEYTTYNNTATITKYTGSETTVTIPARINGKVVSSIEGTQSSYYEYEGIIPRNNRSTKSVIISNGITYIGEYSFYDCSNLTEITIPNSVKYIGQYTFSYCESLTTITIPNSVESIGEGAFYDCSSLTTITIPNSVKYIGQYTFSYCENLMSITIPNSVESIGEGAFSYCESLTAVTIKDGVTEIGEEAFTSCIALTTVTIPSSVEYIGDYAFSYCENLAALTIKDGVTEIGEGSFYDCSNLTAIIIPNSVKYIGDYAFNGCDRMTTAYFRHSDANTITISGDDVFPGKYSDFKIIYPINSINFTTPEWKGYPAKAGEIPDYLPDPSTKIDYNITEIIVTGKINNVKKDDYTINLTTEKFTKPSDYTIKAYSIDGGGTWKAAKSDTFSKDKFSKMLNKDMTLSISNQLIVKSTNQPPENAIIVDFDTINKRPPAPKLVVNYSIAADTKGNTAGDWVLTEKEGTEAVKRGIEVGIANPAKKAVDTNGYGKFKTSGGIAVKTITGSKATKSVYFIRTAPKQEGLTYTAASKPKKISVSSQQKSTKYTVKNKIIKYKANTSIKINGVTTPYTSNGEISVSTHKGTVELWINATAKKPASKKQVINIR